MMTKHDRAREQIAADVEAFLASGKQIQQIPIGVSGDKSLQPKKAKRGQHTNTRMWVKGDKVRYHL